jgi:pimeloyl-ACP methyl ester carboxylesterase
MIFEERLIFFPDRDDRTYAAARAALGHVAGVEDVALAAEDGVGLHGWYLTGPAGGPARPVVLFLHGNAGNVSYWADVYRDLVGLGADVFALDYRGFGRSEGRPDEDGVYRDAAAAWDWLTGTRGIPPDRIVVYGFSLGGGVSTWLAGRHRPAGLVLQSTFTSIPDVAGTIFGPARWFVRTSMDSLSRIPAIECPILVVHGSGDELVPYHLGRRLFDAAPPGTRFHEVPGAGHNETFAAGGAALRDVLKTFLADCTSS